MGASLLAQVVGDPLAPAEIALGKGGPVGLGSPALGAALAGACLCPTPPGWGTGRGGLGLLAMQVVLPCCPFWTQPCPLLPGSSCVAVPSLSSDQALLGKHV